MKQNVRMINQNSAYTNLNVSCGVILDGVLNFDKLLIRSDLSHHREIETANKENTTF